ncbi:hypothetical protein BDB00DRAFT_502929 [Zychaea mexicana]|uniref:uncharacterized protein n=1 Tax=Zychaea mexicana TaxID=64656 RepID=UPI0022FE125D|nr:uncharacterized protein BDB00DRAFT_502929 [Zychaea mexicana]KAI9498189.1 hypothetical protein BDB00DRAFT_502929 [Zychaea mexicana]
MMSVYRDERVDSSESKIIRWLKLDQFEPERAVTSYFVSTKTLFMLRIPLVLYSTIVMWSDIGTSIAAGEFQHYFAYFTRFTFVGLHAYLVTTFCHHIQYLRCQPMHPASFLNQSSILNYLYVFLYHTVVTYNVLTPTVYWALLSGVLVSNKEATPVDWWMASSLHAATFFMMMTEVIMTRMVLHTRMVVLVFGLVLVYLMLAFIIYACESWWVYSFLDWSQGPSAAIWYIAVAVFVILCFFLQKGIHALRDKIGVRRRMVDDDETIMPASEDEEKKVAYDSDKVQHLEQPNDDKRYYSQTLVESSLASHITLGASSTDNLQL